MPVTHGMSYSPEYRAWRSMKQRCCNPRSPKYADYGARGIKICSHWLNDFVAFYRDVGARPSPAFSLDREDNNGDYSPGNCRWATKKQQQRNTRRNRILSYCGIEKTQAEWAFLFSISWEVLHGRLQRGWSVEAALETEIDEWRAARPIPCAEKYVDG